MNIRYDRIIAWGVLLLMIIMLSSFAISAMIIDTSNDSPTTSIEESNISIPEIEVSILEVDIEIAPELPPVEEGEPEEEPKQPAAASYKRYLGDNEEDVKAAKEYCKNEISKRNMIIEEAKILTYYDPDNEYFQLLEQDIIIYTEHCEYYEEKLQEIYNSVKVTQSAKVNPEEAKRQIWIMLRAKGFNEYVTAGIMGNIQAECGFRWNIYSSGKESYGICQWLIKYVPEIADASLEEQIDYLITGKYNMIATFNHEAYNCNYKNIDYEQFINLQDEREAAAAFMLIYERPANTDPTKRSNYASEIYKEFVG